LSQRGNPDLGLRAIQYRKMEAELRASKLQLELERERKKRRQAPPPSSFTQSEAARPLPTPAAAWNPASPPPNPADMASILACLVHQVKLIQNQLGSRF
jgi:hypothetical protein